MWARVGGTAISGRGDDREKGQEHIHRDQGFSPLDYLIKGKKLGAIV